MEATTLLIREVSIGGVATFSLGETNIKSILHKSKLFLSIQSYCNETTFCAWEKHFKFYVINKLSTEYYFRYALAHLFFNKYSFKLVKLLFSLELRFGLSRISCIASDNSILAFIIGSTTS